ncbi:hypothetical protein ZIOFF_072783 [Zingiber officinale]|uniref:HMG box domain-containing protein n=1 Tax=Zingiber officinale TaxID=94328 RepID=A0A8J5ENX1_ZINOF|nr:hypothetical protein ZIOFF_072783 [Zingiber officinale]
MDLIIFAADLAMKREKSKTDASKKTDTKLLVKKGPEQAAKKPRKSKAGKDQLSQEASECLLRLHLGREEFRKTFKEKNPNNKSVAVVSFPLPFPYRSFYSITHQFDPNRLLAREDKWKSLTEEEKAPYIAKAAKLKADYTKTMAAYNKGQSGGGGGSRAVAADEEEEEEEEEEGEESD